MSGSGRAVVDHDLEDLAVDGAVRVDLGVGVVPHGEPAVAHEVTLARVVGGVPANLC